MRLLERTPTEWFRRARRVLTFPVTVLPTFFQASETFRARPRTSRADTTRVLQTRTTSFAVQQRLRRSVVRRTHRSCVSFSPQRGREGGDLSRCQCPTSLLPLCVCACVFPVGSTTPLRCTHGCMIRLTLVCEGQQGFSFSPPPWSCFPLYFFDSPSQSSFYQEWLFLNKRPS